MKMLARGGVLKISQCLGARPPADFAKPITQGARGATSGERERKKECTELKTVGARVARQQKTRAETGEI